MLKDTGSQELILRRTGRYSCLFSEHFKATEVVYNIMELFVYLFHLLSSADTFRFPKSGKLNSLILDLGKATKSENLIFIMIRGA